MEVPTHTTDGPAIVPASGNGSTNIVTTAEAEPQALVTVYEISTKPAATPVTMPPDTVAFVLLALHTPPGVPSVSVIEAPSHTLVDPEIVPAVIAAPIVTSSVAVAVPHEFVTVYITVSTPAVMAVNVPPPEIVALLLVTLHVPPGTTSVYAPVMPTQIVEEPVTVPADGLGVTLTVFTAEVVPQLLVTVYDMVVVPPLTPVTTPPLLMVATPGVPELQTPPGVASESVIVEPSQTVEAPVIVPAVR
jgi:hypothetical protein